MSFLFTVAILAVVLGVLIFVHELGHFLAAKLVGIHVHRFSLGLGTPIRWLTWVRGGTEYSISWLPLGGYVKMASAEEEATSSILEGGTAKATVPAGRMFEAKPVSIRMMVILAGVTMNVWFAWTVYTVLGYKNGRQIDPVTTVGRVVVDSLPPGAEALRDLPVGARITGIDGKPVASWNDIEDGLASAPGDVLTLQLADGTERTLVVPRSAVQDRLRLTEVLLPYHIPVIGQVLPDRPGERAGLAVGDTVLTVDGTPVPQWYDFLGVVRRSPGVSLSISVRRGGQTLEYRVTPQAEPETLPDGTKRSVGRIGVALATDLRTEPYTFGQAVLAGGAATLAASTQIVRTVQGLLSGRVDTREIGGPILIGQLAAQSARLGLDVFLGFMALISVNLAVLNLLPIPVLDGGQFLFLLAEGIIRRPLSLRLRERLTMAGLVLIVLLMVLAFSNDLRRLFGS